MGYVQEIQKTRQTSKTKHTPPPVLAQPEKETVRKQERGKEQPMNRRIITVCENFKEFTDFLLAELNKEPLEGKIPCCAGPIRDWRVWRLWKRREGIAQISMKTEENDAWKSYIQRHRAQTNAIPFHRIYWDSLAEDTALLIEAIATDAESPCLEGHPNTVQNVEASALNVGKERDIDKPS
jgi:hypothetical protein